MPFAEQLPVAFQEECATEKSAQQSRAVENGVDKIHAPSVCGLTTSCAPMQVAIQSILVMGNVARVNAQR